LLDYEDTIQATPRNPFFGGVADLLGQAYKLPEMPRLGVPGLDFVAANRNRLMDLLGVGDVQKTAEAMAYGNRLGTGRGMTYQPLPETMGAAMALAPMVAPAARMVGEGAMATGRFVAPKAGLLAEEYMQGMGTMPGILPQPSRSGMGAFDPRYDPRVNEQARMQAMTRDIQLNPNASNAPTVSLPEFEGRSFITSMADRTAAGGNLLGIDDITFKRPVGLLGGQDFMFNNPGLVWSSGNAPSKALMNYADEIKSATGQNPLYLPYRMAPTGGDFAQMTGETMLAYADASMRKMQKKRLDKVIKGYIPDWSGVSDPASVAQFRAAPDKKRKAIKKAMDKNFRDEGGLNIGSARLAVSDPAQLAAQEGGVQNVGEIFAGTPILRSSHPAYPGGVQGQGIGTLGEDLNIFELLPEVVKARNIPDPRNPRASDLRAMQMKPYAGVITEELLKRLGY
jgi:hypothetical protein